MAYKNRLSNLKINTEDFAYILCKSNKTSISISLSYFSKIEQRQIILDFSRYSLKADLLNNICYVKKNGKLKKINFKKIDTYKEQAIKLLNNNLNDFCSLKDAKKVLKIIHR